MILGWINITLMKLLHLGPYSVLLEVIQKTPSNFDGLWFMPPEIKICLKNYETVVLKKAFLFKGSATIVIHIVYYSVWNIIILSTGF